MASTERVAIVGLGGIFPGARDLDQFWSNIAAGIDSTIEVPEGRWRLPTESVFDPRVAQPDRVYATRGGFIEGFRLDPTRHNVDPDLLDRLDPAFLLGIHAARQAWESAKTIDVDSSRVGVIIGHLILPTETASEIAQTVLGRTFEAALGVPLSDDIPIEPWNALPAGLPAHLIALDLGLGGGTFTLDAACASSLHALKLAADELLSGHADAMITGGLSRPDPLYTQMGFSQLRALSPRGKASPLSAEADGLVVGEGAGMFVLKRLSDAIQHGDTIHGVLAGISLSNDVQGNLLAPSSEGQLRAMRAAYFQAGWQPSDVSLIECHATGTPVGDSVEIESLHQLWRETSNGTCVLGSVKSNIGHALTAANSAGLLKILLALRHQVLPPTANLRNLATSLTRSESPFRVLSKAEPWPQPNDGQPRRAAISGFGFGGINAHALIEEYLPSSSFSKEESPQSLLTPIAIVGIGASLGPHPDRASVRSRLLSGQELLATSEPPRWWGVEIATTENLDQGSRLVEVRLASERFRIPPKELEAMLPQQALMLDVAQAAIEQAGWHGDEPRLRTGVFVGIGLDLNSTNFHVRWTAGDHVKIWNRELGFNLEDTDFDRMQAEVRDAVGPALTADRTMGALGGIVASRLAREFRVGGPSFTVSSDETSGLKALKIACDMLSNGEIDEAIVGAVDLTNDPRLVLARLRLNLTVAGADAAVAFVVKRLADAQRDGNPVFAIVDGIDDGVSMVNAHPIADQSICFPSVNSLIGHAGAAAGLLSVTRAVFALESKILPLGVASAIESQFWLHNRVNGPRRAVVEVKGIDGNQMRISLAEGGEPFASSTEIFNPLGPRPASLFVIEADDRRGIAAGLDQLEALITLGQNSSLDDLTRRWNTTYPRRPDALLAMAIVVEDRSNLPLQVISARRRLNEPGTRPERTNERIFFSDQPIGKADVAFVFPGSGAGFAGMGRALSAQWPEVLRNQERSNVHLKSQLAPETWWNRDLPATFEDHRAPILGQVALGTFFSDLVRSFAITPNAAIGYSLGETAALFALHAWTERDEMFHRLEASPLFSSELAGPCLAARRHWNLADDEPVDWVAGIVPAAAAAVDRSLSGIDRAYRLIVNSSEETVIGGQRSAIARVVHRLGVAFFPLSLVSTVHCPIVTEVADAYRDLHRLTTTPPANVRFYGGMAGQFYPVTRDSAADSILTHALHGFDFTQMIEQAYLDGVRHFVEIGPGGSCTRIIRSILGGRPHLAATATPAEGEPVAGLLSLLGRLIVERVPVDLSMSHLKPPPIDQETQLHSARVVRIPVGGKPFVIPPHPVASGMAHPPTVQPSPRNNAESNSRMNSATPISNPHETMPALEPMSQQWMSTTQAVGAAHEVYLRLAQSRRCYCL